MTVVARNIYDPYVAPFEGAPGAGIECGPSLTKQADLKDSDINLIMKRWEKTGTFPDLVAREPRYGDFSDPVDFQEALNIVRVAEAQFAALDAHVRTRFDNDPEKFLAFMADADNQDEAVKLGLAVLKPEEIARRKAEADARNAEAAAKASAELKAAAK